LEQRLTLAAAAAEISIGTMLSELSDVAAHSAPSFDLPRIIVAAPTHPVTAIPLKPAARIVGVDPALLPPVDKRFRGADAEEIQTRIVAIR
jgi:hypothetical protein